VGRSARALAGSRSTWRRHATLVCWNGVARKILRRSIVDAPPIAKTLVPRREAEAGPAAGPAPERQAVAKSSIALSKMRPSKAAEETIAEIDFAARAGIRAMSKPETERLLRRLSKKLAAAIVLDWADDGTSISAQRDSKSLTVAGGLFRSAELSEDARSLMLCRGAAHLGRHHDEAQADFWATRHGLRLIWGEDARSDRFIERACRAVHLALTFERSEDKLDPSLPDLSNAELLAGGPRSLRARWQISKAGILGKKSPFAAAPSSDDRPRDSIDRRELAAALGAPESAIEELGAISGVLERLHTADGERYARAEVEALAARIRDTEHALLVRNQAQIALAMASDEPGTPGEKMMAMIGKHGGRFGDLWDRDHALRLMLLCDWTRDRSGCVAELQRRWESAIKGGAPPPPA
jgi:hypothetical protein